MSRLSMISAAVILGVVVFIAVFDGINMLDPLVIKAKDAVREEMADPESVQFRKARRISDFEVCGEFNAKNKMGGYTGYEPFLVTSGVVMVNKYLIDGRCD